MPTDNHNDFGLWRRQFDQRDEPADRGFFYDPPADQDEANTRAHHMAEDLAGQLDRRFFEEGWDTIPETPCRYCGEPTTSRDRGGVVRHPLCPKER